MKGSFENFMEAALSNKGFGGENKRDYEFFALEDGETKTYRFVTGFDVMYAFNCECGIHYYEVGETLFEESVQGGKPVACPKCGKPLTKDMIVAKRPRGLTAMRHSFVPGESGRKKSFTCLGEDCPICAVRNNDGKPAYPARGKVVMYAIEQDVDTDTIIDETTGTPRRVIMSIKSAMVDGKPKLVQFERSGSFFGPVYSLFKNDGRCDHYLFSVTRVGTGLNTTYAVDRIGSEPTPEPITNYVELLTKVVDDTEKQYSAMGTEKYYNKNGWYIAGKEDQVIAQEFAPQAVDNGVDWDAVKSQVADSNTDVAWGTVKSQNDGTYL